QGDDCDVSIGTLLNGERLRELDPELPACYRRAGIELARLRLWPAQNELQLKVVLHSQDPQCDWLPLEITARLLGGDALRAKGRHGDAPREGWREVAYNFAFPSGATSVRLELAGPTRPLEAWRVDLDRREVHRVGHALAGRIDAPGKRVQLPTATGCAHLEGVTLDRLWVEQADGGRRQLQVRAAFATRKDGTAPCRQQAQLVLLDSRS